MARMVRKVLPGPRPPSSDTGSSKRRLGSDSLIYVHSQRRHWRQPHHQRRHEDRPAQQRRSRYGNWCLYQSIDRWSYNACGRCIELATSSIRDMSWVPICSSIYIISGDCIKTLLIVFLLQSIESDMISDFLLGARPMPSPVIFWSFWVKSSFTGLFGGGVVGNGGSSAVIHLVFLSLAAASMDEDSYKHVPGDTAGDVGVVWERFGGCFVTFDLGTKAGVILLAPTGAWISGNYIGATGGQSGLIPLMALTYDVTGVKLEIGSVATPFNRQSLAKSLADCQRYYLTTIGEEYTYLSVAGAQTGNTITYPVTMRTSPTVTPTWTTQANATSMTINGLSASSCLMYGNAVAVGQINIIGTLACSAEL